MLTAIRSLARSPIFGGFIVVILVAAFALFGLNDIFRGSGDAAVLVGSERVSVRELSQAYERQIQQIQNDNPRFTREQADQIGLGEQLVQILTIQRALDAKTTELGLSLSDNQLLESLSSIQAFQNAFSGEFDRSAYAQILSDNGYRGQAGARLFETELASEMVRNQMINSLFGSLDTPDIMALARQAHLDEQRTIQALILPPSLTDGTPEPDDETLTNFINDNPQIFMRPEMRRFTLIRATPEDFVRDVDVDEQTIEDLYTFRLETGQLADPATRSFTQWAFNSEAEAQAGLEVISNADAADIAMLGDPLEFSDVEAFEIPDTGISTAVFDLSDGEIAVAEGQLGWRVVRIDAAFDPDLPTLDELRDELIEEIARDEAEGNMLDALARLEEARANGMTLEQASISAGLPAEQFDLVTDTSSDLAGFRLATLTNETDILTSVFGLPEGFPSDLQNFGENGYFIARVDEIKAPHLPTLEEVRDEVDIIWRVRTVDEQLSTLATQAFTRYEAGETLDAIAQSLGPQARVEITTVARGGSAGIFDPQMVGTAFTMVENRPFQTRVGDQRSHAIAIVTDVIGPTQTNVPAEIGTEIANEVSDDAIGVFQNGLLNSYTVRTDQRLVDLALGRIDPTQP